MDRNDGPLPLPTMSDTSRGTSKSASPVPSQEECDAAYSRARNSLDGRAAPFVPGVGRLSQDFNSVDLSAIDLGGETRAHTYTQRHTHTKRAAGC